MTVSDLEMDRFIQAVSSSDSPKYYLPEEITLRCADVKFGLSEALSMDMRAVCLKYEAAR